MLGVGDAAAAAVGSVLGRHRWPSSRRTLEGSLAFFLSTLGMVEWLKGGREGGREGGAKWGWVVAVGLLALLEAFTSQVDNLVLPVYAVALFNLAWKVGRDGGGEGGLVISG